MCADFDAMLRHDWRRLGVSAEEVREFCVCHARAELAGRPGGQLRSGAEGAPHRVLLAFDGRCYMYRAVRRVLERQAARVLYRGEARQTLPPIQEWRRFDAADVQPGLFWCEDLREARRQLSSSYCGEAGHQDPRAGGGARGAAEVVRQECRGQRLTGLAHEIFLKLLKAKREVPGAAERQGLRRAGRQVRAVRLRADGGRLRAGPHGAGEAGLCGQRANSAGAVRRLPQREDAEQERAAHEFGEPRGSPHHGVRPEPQAASSCL